MEEELENITKVCDGKMGGMTVVGKTKEKSLSEKQEEIFEWIKTQYDDKFGLDLIALIIDRIMQNEREAVRRLKEKFPKNRIQIQARTIHKEIDKIMGEKLI